MPVQIHPAGVSNWRVALRDPGLYHALWVTFEIMILSWLVQTPISLLLGVFLAGRQRLLGFDRRLIVTARQRPVPAKTIDMGIVQDGEQPGAQVAATAEALSLLEGAHQRIMHKVFGIIRIAHQRTRIAP